MAFIKVGVSISTGNIPPAFYKWYRELPYEYKTIEIKNGEIQVVRVRTVVDSDKAVENLNFGKIISDSSGDFLERTFIPRYVAERDEIVLEQ